MWSYLTTRSSLTPLLGHVEDKPCGAQRPAPHCESVAEGMTSVRYKAIARCPGNWLLRLTPVMQQRLFCQPQHQLVSYHNYFIVGWCDGLDWKQRS